MMRGYRRLNLILYAFLLSSPAWIKPLGWWVAYSPSSVLGGFGSLVFGLDSLSNGCLLIAVPTLLIAPFLLLFPSSLKSALSWFLASLLIVTSFLIGSTLGLQTQKQGIERFIKRSDPLIRAITAYEVAHGRPSAMLTDLVPDFLREVPSPQLSNHHSPYIYLSGKESQEYSENPWTLRVSPPSNFMSFDLLLYFPRRNYPEYGYGGHLERFGDWAYVHE